MNVKCPKSPQLPSAAMRKGHRGVLAPLGGEEHQGKILRAMKNAWGSLERNLHSYRHRSADTGLGESTVPGRGFYKVPDGLLPGGMLRAWVCFLQGLGFPRAATGVAVGAWGREKRRTGRGSSLSSGSEFPSRLHTHLPHSFVLNGVAKNLSNV